MKIDSNLESALLDHFQCEKIRLEQSEVHGFGTMPNTNQVGWFFIGFVEDVNRDWQTGKYN